VKLFYLPASIPVGLGSTGVDQTCKLKAVGAKKTAQWLLLTNVSTSACVVIKENS